MHMGTRKFKCASCGYEFELPFGSGTSGKQTVCPKCGGIVHRVNAGVGAGQAEGFRNGQGNNSNGRGPRR
ncbi:MAG: Zinc ribbon domain [Clostridiales bacterium]|jgi:DNA-directed RNA polymerase subunit RPC12/RpoP|nr:Zinc ribbon domain [Clostridiales bacterium]